MANRVTRKLNVIRAKHGDPGSFHIAAHVGAGSRDDAGTQLVGGRNADPNGLSRYRECVCR